MKKKHEKLEENFDIISDDDILASTDIANALSVINSANCLPKLPKEIKEETKKFVVEKNKKLKEITTKTTFDEKVEIELEEIVNQADQAFYDLMDKFIESESFGKGTAEIASVANNFLNLKLNAVQAKFESKLKKMNYGIQLKRLEMMASKSNNTKIEVEEDDIIIVDGEK